MQYEKLTKQRLNAVEGHFQDWLSRITSDSFAEWFAAMPTAGRPTIQDLMAIIEELQEWRSRPTDADTVPMDVRVDTSKVEAAMASLEERAKAVTSILEDIGRAVRGRMEATPPSVSPPGLKRETLSAEPAPSIHHGFRISESLAAQLRPWLEDATSRLSRNPPFASRAMLVELLDAISDKPGVQPGHAASVPPEAFCAVPVRLAAPMMPFLAWLSDKGTAPESPVETAHVRAFYECLTRPSGQSSARAAALERVANAARDLHVGVAGSQHSLGEALRELDGETP